jgi:RNA polymerase primary sigma factor
MNGNEAKECHVPNPLQSYFRDITQNELLSAADERVLADAIARGDRDARTRMIQANLRLVVKIAREYLGRGMALEDLIGEGNLGLIRAAEDYDPRFGTRFSTYASYWIKQAIRHALINTTSTIRLPAHMVGLLTRWRRAERTLSRERGCIPSFDEIAAHLELTETQKELVTKAHCASQLKLESSLGDDEVPWSSRTCAWAEESVEDGLDRREERAEVLKRMERLDDRERLILSLRFGLASEPPQTFQEIGRRLGVTREWVRKIELRAMSKLVAATVTCSSPCSPRAGRPRGRPRRPIPAQAMATTRSAC